MSIRREQCSIYHVADRYRKAQKAALSLCRDLSKCVGGGGNDVRRVALDVDERERLNKNALRAFIEQ